MSVSLLALLGLDSVTPSRVIVQDELEAGLRGALQDLQPRHREAVTLHVLQGLSVGESAQQMGCTVGQFRGYLQRGLDNLRANPRLKELIY
jgi:RNA polymerase sigma factor (sigma-70 family)